MPDYHKNLLCVSEGFTVTGSFPLDINLTNKDGSKTIYSRDIHTAQKDPKLNELTLSIQNNSEQDLTLLGGEMVAENSIDRGITAFYLNFSNILSPAAFANLTIVCKSHPKQWRIHCFGEDAHTDSHHRAWAFIPTANTSLILQPHQRLEFLITQLECESSALTTRAIISYYHVGELEDGFWKETLPITPPPNRGNKPFNELKLKCDFLGDQGHIVYVNPYQTPNGPELENRLRFWLCNTDEKQPLVAPGNHDTPPKFKLSFVLDDEPGPGVLTTSSHFKKIMVTELAYNSRDDAVKWKVDQKLDNDRPYWILTPLNPEILGTGKNSSSEFVIDFLVVDGAPYSLGDEPTITFMYLQCTNIPGYNAGTIAIPIEKRFPNQSIIKFFPDQYAIRLGEEVNLSWQTFAAEHIKLICSEGTHVTDKAEFTNWQHPKNSKHFIDTTVEGFKRQPKHDANYSLILYPSDSDKEQASRSFSVKVLTEKTTITSFTVTPQIVSPDYIDRNKTMKATLSWKIDNLNDQAGAIMIQTEPEGKKPDSPIYISTNIPSYEIEEITRTTTFRMIIANKMYPNNVVTLSVGKANTKILASHVNRVQNVVGCQTLNAIQGDALLWIKMEKEPNIQTIKLKFSNKAIAFQTPRNAFCGISPNGQVGYVAYQFQPYNPAYTTYLRQLTINTMELSNEKQVSSQGYQLMHLWVTHDTLYLVEAGDNLLSFSTFSNNNWDNTCHKISPEKGEFTLPGFDTKMLFSALIHKGDASRLYAIKNGIPLQVLQLKNGAITVIKQVQLVYKDACCLHVSEKRHLLFIGYERGMITILDTNTESVAGQLSLNHHVPTAMATDPEERYLYVACQKELILVLDIASGLVINSLQGFGNMPEFLSVTEDCLYQFYSVDKDHGGTVSYLPLSITTSQQG